MEERCVVLVRVVVFFFQAEDGIRDLTVTGVQTCALPISLVASVFGEDRDFLARVVSEVGPSHGRILAVDPSIASAHTGHGIVMPQCNHRSEERRVGKECRSRWSPYH